MGFQKYEDLWAKKVLKDEVIEIEVGRTATFRNMSKDSVGPAVFRNKGRFLEDF